MLRARQWLVLLSASIAAGLLVPAGPACADLGPLPKLTVDFGGEAGQSPTEMSASLQILLLLTVLSLAPAIVTMLTSFARTVIVLSFTRSALGTQQVPPNSVLIGLAIFLTAYTMAPVWSRINEDALQPYTNQSITYEVALARATGPVRDFMFSQVRQSDLELFVGMAGAQPQDKDDIPTYVLAPAFILSELKTSFIMGFIIFVPFVIVDMVVASTLMSMGMMMMPPMLISLPCKLLLFIMVDGWHLITQGLLTSFA
jgi:flagellar biosynthetic protein FliP